MIRYHMFHQTGRPAEDLVSNRFLFQSFARIRKWLEHAKSSPNLSIIAGSRCDDRKGYFVEPTIIETKDPLDPIMQEVRPLLGLLQDPELWDRLTV